MKREKQYSNDATNWWVADDTSLQEMFGGLMPPPPGKYTRYVDENGIKSAVILTPDEEFEAWKQQEDRP